MGLKRSNGLRPGAELVAPNPTQNTRGEGGELSMQDCLLAPPRSLQIPCLRPSSPSSFLSSPSLYSPVFILFLLVPLCLPQSLSGPDQDIKQTRPLTGQASLFLTSQADFQPRCQSTCFLPSSLFLGPVFLHSFFPLHFLTKPF